MGRVKLDVNKLLQFAEAEAMGGLRKAAERIQMSAKLSATSQFKDTTVRNGKARPKTVQFLARKGKSKTAFRLVKYTTTRPEIRYPGQLRDSIRVVEKEGKKTNLRVYEGHYNAYYAHMVERGTSRPTKAHWIMKNALNVNRTYARRLINDSMKLAVQRSNQLVA